MEKYSYDNGYFVHVSDQNWQEWQDGQNTFSFQESERTGEWITLYDGSRRIFVSLPLAGGQAYYMWEGLESWTPLCIVGLTETARPPSPSVPDDWYVKEEQIGPVCCFVKEHSLLEYAARRVPKSVRASHPDLDHPQVRRYLNFWCQERMITFLGRLFELWVDHWGGREDTPLIFLGDISKRKGGQLHGHNTHQHGTCVDIYYVTSNRENKTITCLSAESDGMDYDANAVLLNLIFEAGRTTGDSVWYVITECERILTNAEFVEYSADGRLRSKPPHRDHFHVELR